MKRVVVTGLGVVSPIGNNIETYWENLKNGVCGIDFITLYDPKDMPVKLAAEVKNFNIADYEVDKGMAHRSDRFCQFALAAASQAMKDSDLAGKIAPERLGVYVGSGIG